MKPHCLLIFTRKSENSSSSIPLMDNLKGEECLLFTRDNPNGKLISKIKEVDLKDKRDVILLFAENAPLIEDGILSMLKKYNKKFYISAIQHLGVGNSKERKIELEKNCNKVMLIARHNNTIQLHLEEILKQENSSKNEELFELIIAHLKDDIKVDFFLGILHDLHFYEGKFDKLKIKNTIEEFGVTLKKMAFEYDANIVYKHRKQLDDYDSNTYHKWLTQLRELLLKDLLTK